VGNFPEWHDACPGNVVDEDAAEPGQQLVSADKLFVVQRQAKATSGCAACICRITREASASNIPLVTAGKSSVLMGCGPALDWVYSSASLGRDEVSGAGSIANMSETIRHQVPTGGMIA
jgi:hypothetical protein